MDCKESEKIIYLFKESSESDRMMLMRHLEGCKNCARLFAEVEAANKIIGSAAKQKFEPENAGALTSRIMDAIPSTSKSAGVWESLMFLFDLPALRYGMALASIMIIGLFIAEYQDTGSNIGVTQSANIPSSGIVIRASGLRQEFMTREKRASIFECSGAFSTKIDLDCIKEKIEKLSF